MPCVVRTADGAGGELLQLGHPLVDDYLQFVAARARRNTLVAYAFDLKAFFLVVGKDPVEVSGADVLAFVQAQQAGGDSKVVRLSDGGSGVSARTIRRRLSAVSGLYAYLCARGDAGVSANPVPKGLATRASRRGTRQTPLVRTPRTLPQVLAPAEVGALVAALRTHRDRAMVEAMLLGGLRRCEVLGLRLEDLKLGQRRVFVVDGKGGHQRLAPISSRFFSTAGAYLEQERPPDAPTDRLFVVLKGARRGQPLSVAGMDEILRGARSRAGLERGTCHELRHTCLTRLREAGMALEAVGAQAGHRSIESTRIYLHLANDWLAGEYRRAAEAIDAQQLVGATEGRS